MAASSLLEAVESAIEALLSGGAVQEYQYGDRNVKYMSLGELQALRRELKAESASEGGGRTFAAFS